MIQLRLTEITAAMLVSSSVAEDDHPEYAPATIYAAGDRCMVTATHRIYESTQDANQGNYPPDNLGGIPPWWLEVSVTNRWQMLDGVVGTLTTNADSIVLAIKPGQINGISLMEVAGSMVTVVMTDPVEGEVYRREVSMVSNGGINTWYAYYYEPVVRKTDLVLLDLPVYSQATLTVTIANPGGVASCGLMGVGRKWLVGALQWNPQISILDYSTTIADQWGHYSLVPGKSAKLLDGDISLLSSRVDEARWRLNQDRATPSVWIGSELYGSTHIYGFYRSLKLVIQGPRLSTCSLQLIGLI